LYYYMDSSLWLQGWLSHIGGNQWGSHSLEVSHSDRSQTHRRETKKKKRESVQK
jgi:hypothetical protein